LNTFTYLFNPDYAALFWPPVVTGLAIAVLSAALSVLVVLKRLAFVGQGVSHAAFGGVGLAFVFGLTGAVGATAGEAFARDLGLFVVVLAFCVAAALAIARLSDRGTTRPDTAIGIVLVASMAVGFLLHRWSVSLAGRGGRPPPPGIEAVLFGSILDVGFSDIVLAWIVVAVVCATLWYVRRPLLFWVFDEPAAEAFGVAGGRMKTLLMVLLALAIVLTMRLAGVVLATAMLVLPGAAALQLSDRMGRVLWLSLAAAVVGVLGGLVASFEWDLQPGPCIVLALAGLYGLSRAPGRGRRGPDAAAEQTPG
jgi:ABC-type Mn2+/Zn2+ transport system permease subunit